MRDHMPGIAETACERMILIARSESLPIKIIHRVSLSQVQVAQGKFKLANETAKEGCEIARQIPTCHFSILQSLLHMQALSSIGSGDYKAAHNLLHDLRKSCTEDEKRRAESEKLLRRCELELAVVLQSPRPRSRV